MQRNKLSALLLTLAYILIPLGTAQTLTAQIFDEVVISKIVSYEQTAAGSVSLAAGTPYTAEAFMVAADGVTVNPPPTMTPPGGSATLLTLDDDEWIYEIDEATSGALDTEFPSGDYQFSASTSSGPFNLTLSFPNLSYPNTPECTNFNDAQAIDASTDFTLIWNSFSGGTTDDLIFVEIEDAQGNEVFYEGDVNETIDGTSTQITIPASVFSSGTTYNASISFAKVASFDDSLIPTAATVYESLTSFQIQTTGAVGDDDAIELFLVTKFQNYEQTSEGIIALQESGNEDPLGFEAFIEVSGSSDLVTSATVTPPNAGPIALLADDNDWEYLAYTDLLAELDETFPSGDYTISAQTTSGPLNLTLNLSSDNYPNIPRVTNYDNAQEIDPSSDFTLNWNSFTGGTSGDYVFVYIEDDQGNEILDEGGPDSGITFASTQLMIPQGTLSAGTNYTVELTFLKVVDFDDTVVPLGVASYLTSTSFEIRTTGQATDFNPPSLMNTSPFGGETDVPVDSVIVLEFSEAMSSVSTDFTVTLDEVISENFESVWSDDYTRLYALYVDAQGDPVDMPFDTEIEFTISGNMTDLAGNPIGSDTMRSFTTASSPSTSTSDVEAIFIVKSQSFFQDGPTPVNDGVYSFEAEIELGIRNSVIASSLFTPTSNEQPIYSEQIWDDLVFEATYLTEADLDLFFPTAGDYKIDIETARGVVSQGALVSANLSFAAGDYPSTPTLSDVSQLAALDSEQPFTLEWDALNIAGGTTSDDYVIGVTIWTESGFEVFATEDEDILASDTFITIPAGTLAPGRSYEGELFFARIADEGTQTGPSGPNAVAAFVKYTFFEIETSGEPITPEATINYEESRTDVTINGEGHIIYNLEASTDLVNWLRIGYTRMADENGEVTFSDYDSIYFAQRFYRAVESSDGQFLDAPIVIQGRVVDNQFNPIEGALVSTTLDGNTVTSASDGSFFLISEVTRNNNPGYTIEITKSGYQDLFDFRQSWEGQIFGWDFTLQEQ